MEFPCNSCGLCCRHVDRSDITKLLDRGDGVCGYFIDKTSKCSIYSERPSFCRVEESYYLFESMMSLGDYYGANAHICNLLHHEHGLVDFIEIKIGESG